MSAKPTASAPTRAPAAAPLAPAPAVSADHQKQQRFVSIMTAPEAEGRKDLAAHLANNTNLTVDQARAQMQTAAPDAEAMTSTALANYRAVKGYPPSAAAAVDPRYASPAAGAGGATDSQFGQMFGKGIGMGVHVIDYGASDEGAVNSIVDNYLAITGRTRRQ